MKPFPDFYDSLQKDNPQWWDFTRLRFFSKDLKKCAMDCYAYILADEKLQAMESASLRKYFISWLMKAPDAPVAPTLQQVEEVKVETDPAKLPIPKSDPRYQKYLNDWLQALKSTEGNFRIPRMSRKEFEENGGWEPKKEQLYPPTTIEEAKIRDKHFRYIQSNYEPRTGNKLPEWKEEKIWNEINE